MNTAILISFTVPAIVTTALTIMLIRERDYFFHNRSNYHSEDGEEKQKVTEYKKIPDNISNHCDFSGGTLGL